MSDQQPPPRPAARPSTRPARNIGLAILLILCGLILLLPGACSVFFLYDGVVTWLGFMGLAIGLAGLWLIGKAIWMLSGR